MAGKGVSRRAIIATIGCCLQVFCTAAAFWACNVLLPEMIHNPALGMTSKAMASPHTALQCASAMVFGIFGGRIIGKLTPKWAMFTGGIVSLAYVLGIGFIESYPLWTAWGAVAGYAMAIGTLSSVAGLMQENYGGKSQGIFASITGVQTLIIAGWIFFQGFLLRTGFDYHQICGICAVIVVCGLVINLLMIKPPSAEERAEIMKDTEHGEADITEVGLTPQEAMKTPVFWIYIIAMMCGAIIAGAFTHYSTLFFTTFGMDTGMASYLVGFLSIFGAIHGLYLGFFQRKFGSRAFLFLLYGGIIVGFAILFIWAGAQVLWIAVVGLFFCAFLRNIMATPMIVMTDLFGRKAYVGLSSFGQAAYNAGMMISMVVSTIVLDALGGIGCLFYLIAVAAVSLVLYNICLSLSPMKKIRAEEAARMKAAEQQ